LYYIRFNLLMIINCPRACPGAPAGSDPESLRWNVQAELVHCRWAMLGAAGIFIPEFLTKIGILNTPFWYTAGEQQYFTDTTTLFIIEIILIGWAEGRRWADIIKPGSVNTDPVFPNNKLTGTDVGYSHASSPRKFSPSIW
jgi:light-harvesting complex I chlorophyll a/b binding protein 2